MEKKISIILIVIFVLQVGFRIYSYENLYSIPFNFNYWQKFYNNSQWTPAKACTNLDPHVNPYTCIWDDNWYAKHKNDPNVIFLKKHQIGDDGLYTYAGWEYIHGHDPTTLNPEVPPFGKYLIGLSELLFHNQYIFALLSTLFALLAFYLLNLTLFKKKLLAFIPVVLFSFDPLLYTQFGTTLLDSLYLGLLLLVFYFFLNKKYIYSSLCLGLLAATKSSSSTFLLVIIVSILYLLYARHKDQLIKYLVSLPVAFFVFCLTYLLFFWQGHSFKAFLGVQKWVFLFYSTGAKGSLISPWEMIFTGKWHTWWGTYTPFYRWHIAWPLLILLFVVALFTIVNSKYTKPISFLALWVSVYLLFLSFIPTWPRYLLLILPFLYTIAVWVIILKSPKGKHFKAIQRFKKYV